MSCGSIKQEAVDARAALSPEEIVAKPREAETLLGQGKEVPEVVEAIGIRDVDYQRCLKGSGGLNFPQAKCLKYLERYVPPALAGESPLLPS